MYTDQIIKDIIEYSWIGLDKKDILATDFHALNPFNHRTQYDIENPLIFVLQLMRNIEFIDFTCRKILNVELLPQQIVILQELWYRPFPMLVANRGWGKTWLLALYAVLRMLLLQGRKVVVVGAAFRQAKHLFSYAESIWYNAPVLRDICKTESNQGARRDTDRCTLKIGSSTLVALPLGTGEKIRGERANDTISEEFASTNKEIFETVIGGFGVVSALPVDKVKIRARERMAKKLGKTINTDDKSKSYISNQTIISGTAYYAFNHFADYHKKYCAIVNSRGNKKKLEKIFGKDGIPNDFNWKDYCVIRIPDDLLPPGFLDEKQIARAKATIHSGTYLMEYKACFVTDSKGFFKRSLIEACTSKEKLVLPSGPAYFHAVTKGDMARKYVYAIDPASEADNFSIQILEMWPEHRRIVYGWTTTRSEHKDKLKRGLVQEHDFYGYCARKIRNLMRVFPCIRIALDKMGGGVAVMEALHDPDKMEIGEIPIWEVIDENKPKDTDDNVGLHILELIQFANADWTAAANHGMRKDMEDKVLLFPYFDPLSVAFAIQDDKIVGRKFDTLEDCVMEIEELKDELCTIVHSQTGIQGRDRWDTPEIKLSGGKKGRMRKDRYSALLMANMIARTMQRTSETPQYKVTGGFASDMAGDKSGGKQLFHGPAWFVEGNKQASTAYTSVRRA